jgi:hypothetical protein
VRGAAGGLYARPARSGRVGDAWQAALAKRAARGAAGGRQCAADVLACGDVWRRGSSGRL